MEFACGHGCLTFKERIRTVHMNMTSLFRNNSSNVAPLAGAWIETVKPRGHIIFISRSRPSRARGLKHCLTFATYFEDASRPSRARGLKRLPQFCVMQAILSRPSRARGLKLARIMSHGEQVASRPSRARGLKQVHSGVMIAPLMGAWIETSSIILDNAV